MATDTETIRTCQCVWAELDQRREFEKMQQLKGEPE